MAATQGIRALTAGVGALLVLVAACGDGDGSDAPAAAQAAGPSFSDPLTIDNPYAPLSAHRRCEIAGETEDGTVERSVTTPLRRTRTFEVDGRPVETLVIRDRAFEDGELVERTLDYFAQADDGTVHYFGEEVENIESGEIVDRAGTWLYGEDTEVLGVLMPPDPRTGDQWRFEDATPITVESNRVEETGLRIEVGGELHDDVIRVQEFTHPDGEIEYKLYGPGIGLLREYTPGATIDLLGCE